jgi:glutathione synthase/RimK-type ligase-like ATP-grasp enzyme
MKRVAILTEKNKPTLIQDEEQALAQAHNFGLDLVVVDWEEKHNWQSFDLVLTRTVWNYTEKAQAYFNKLAEIETHCPLLNPAITQKWNADKTYLLNWKNHKLPLPETHLIQTQKDAMAFVSQSQDIAKTSPQAKWVLKPTLSASGRDTYLLSAEELSSFQWQLCHFEKCPFLLQRFIPEIQTEGEISLLFFKNSLGIRFSHALRKCAGRNDFRIQAQYGGSVLSLPDVSPKLVEWAAERLEEIPYPWFYARVDLVESQENPHSEKKPLLMECEMIEPELFLRTHPEATHHYLTWLYQCSKDFSQ